ncbi:hypothetical protein P5V34_00655 [Mycobacteroides abscessus subsp. abscessus]|uniref:HNH endonuclease n=1 Tax=Mycobacteroides abscessus TaxID=36809 RepID=UPI00266C529D|nr:hypothetical protein [Mycobacteroides abscessus]MDO3012490.1 hypothetical protein [Mycobacteroides abscessus subsp. abscessus]
MTVDRLPVLYPRPWDVKTELEQLYISLRREWGWLETAWIPDPRTLNPGTCRNCGLALVPLSRGGWDYSTNLVPSCKPCNVHKHARLLSEWDNKKVARAVSVSPKVAMAYLIEVLGIGRPVLVPIPTDEQVLAAYPPRKYVKEEVSA